MKTTQRYLQHGVVTNSAMIAIASLVLFACSPSASAQTQPWTTNGNNINNTNTGNVGVGTSAPGTSLDVAGNTVTVGSEPGTNTRNNNTLKWSRIAMPPYTSSNLRFALLGGATTSNANIVAVGGEVGGMAAATQIDFFTAPTTNIDTGTLRMTINGAGNVGIGTNAPDVKLQVHHASSNTSTANMQLADLSFAFRNTSNTNGNMSLISFQDAGGWGTAQIGAIQINQASHVGELVFFTKGGAFTSERMRIKSDGRIGIGITTPGFLLDVQGGQINASGGLCINGDCKTAWSQVGGSGVTTTSAANISAGQFGQNTGGGNYTFPANVVVNGTINAKYQDVAEWVPAAHAMSAGTVVVLNPTQSNHVIASAQAYDTRVAGVISETPGLSLGEGGPGKVLVATTGRVRVKVDASSGPIAIGDLLVTSDIQGVAMKSKPLNVGGAALHRPGTLIGKALEPLAKGRGEILVLLSLQ